MQTVDCLDIIIEITPETKGVKYEFDKTQNCLRVDRFLSIPSLSYPMPYGFAPETLSEDGDPLDVMVIVPQPVLPGVRMKVTPIGALIMEDESGLDEKILAVPSTELSGNGVRTFDGISDLVKDQIKYFFIRVSFF